MTAPWEKYAQGDGPWGKYAGSEEPTPIPARQRVPDIPGTPEGYADRVAMIPGAVPGTVAPPAQRAAPVPQEERGLFARIRAGLEAARYTVASIVPGAVGYGVGVLEGIARTAANAPPKDWKPGENLAETRAQQFVEATVNKPPTALGREYAQDVGDFARRHGASVAAGPLGLTGSGRHTRVAGDVGTGLRAALGTPGDAPPGLPPVAPSAEKPAGGLAKRVVQPNPALLENVKSAEKAGLTVLPHHVAEGDAVRALGTAAGGDVYKQNTKAFTKALIKELDPDETAPRLDTKTFHRVLDKQGKTIGENMAKYDMPVDDALRARLEAISKDAADNADADTGRMTMNRVREILGKAEAGEGQIAGQAVRELDTAIGRQIRSNTKNQDLVARLRAVQDVLRDAAERQMKPDEAKAVQQARRRYAYAMEILPDIDDFGRTGYYEPGQLWKRLTSSEAGRQRVANERGGLTDLAKAGALVADRSGTGHGYVSVGSSGVGVGVGGMRTYASPSRIAEVAIGAIGGKKAYNRFGPNLVKRLAAEHDAEMARAAQAPEPPPLELAPEGTPAPQAPRPDVRGEAPAEVPEWSTAAGVDAQKPGSQIPAIEPEGLLPAVGDDIPPARINPEQRGRVPDIPAVPGRPGMPDVMVAGGPGEVAATEATGRAMQSPGAALAREQQGFAPKKPEPPSGGGGGGSAPPSGGLDPRLAKIAELRRRSTSPAVTKVLDAQEAELKKTIKRETDIAELEAAAQATDDPGLRQSLLAEANKLRGGKLPVGEVKEGQPDLPKPKTEKIPVGQVIEGQPELPAAKAERIPVGEATEITPEVVEAAPERLPVGEATEMPERLPVGEVTENPIPVGEAMEFDRLPVGEVTEITPDVVEPAAPTVLRYEELQSKLQERGLSDGEYAEMERLDPTKVSPEEASALAKRIGVPDAWMQQRRHMPKLGLSEDVIRAQHHWETSRARLNRLIGRTPIGAERIASIEDGVASAMGQRRIAADRAGYMERVAAAFDTEIAAAEKRLATPGTLENARAKRNTRESLRRTAEAVRKDEQQEIDMRKQKLRELERQGRLSPDDIDSFSDDMARSDGVDDALDAADRLIDAKDIAAERSQMSYGREAAANEPVVPEATNVDNAPTAPAGGGRSEGMEQTKITHAGMEIEEIPAQGGEPTRWQVTVPETGERMSTPSGLDAAKRIAESERKVIDRSGTTAQRAKAAEETAAAEERARAEAKKARSAATAGKSLAEIKAMDHMNRTIRVGGKDMKAHEFVDARLAAGDTPKMALVDRVAPMSRRAFNRASNAEQRAHEAKVKAGGKKKTYWLGGYGLSKTEYDYAVKKAAAQQENTRAPQEVTQQAGVPAEPQGRTGGREAAEAGAGDRVQRAAESGGQAEGAKKEGVKPARPAPKPTGKALSPAEVKAEFQRQIDAVPRFDDGGPETITLKAGGSTVKLQNTARRVAEYMKALDTVKGGKTPKPKSGKSAGPITSVKGFYGEESTKSWGEAANNRAPLKTITDMIDDFDSQAAVDFAAAQGIDLEVALKDDRKRLDRVRNLKPTPETP